MSTNIKKEPNIKTIRARSRRLGMSRGRITRNLKVHELSDINHFQFELLMEKDTPNQQKEIVKLLLLHDDSFKKSSSSSSST